jgi:hypothetical protein
VGLDQMKTLHRMTKVEREKLKRKTQKDGNFTGGILL